MGGGAPLAFLNKKTWHPGRLQNVEEVWKREQAAAREAAALAELQKQIAEERERQELHQVAEAAGIRDKSDRLDWMYQSGMVARAEAQKRAEETLLSGKEAPSMAAPAPEEAGKVDKLTLLPSFYAEDTPASANETWARLHSDPLFAIRQQEQAARKKIVSNPVKMDEIKREVARVQQESKAGKKAKKEAKKLAKQEKKQLKAAMEAMKNGDLGAAAPAPAPAPPAAPARGRSASPPPAKRRRASRSASPQRQAHDRRESYAQPDLRQHSQRDGRLTDSNGRDLPERAQRLDARQEREGHRYSNGLADRGHDSRREGADRDRGRDREGDRSRDRDRRDRDRSRDRDRRDRDRSRDRAGGSDRNTKGGRREVADRPDDRHGRRDDKQGAAPQPTGEQRASRPPLPGNGAGAAQAPAHHHDSASAQGRDLSYGLNQSSKAPEGLSVADRSAAAEATRRRLAEAAAAREAAEREKEAQRFVKRDYRPGKLTAEEKAARLAEMAGNAVVHEEARWDRLKRAREDDSADAQPGTRHHSETATFLTKTTAEVYGTAGEAASLEERVNRQRYFQARKGEAAFRRE